MVNYLTTADYFELSADFCQHYLCVIWNCFFLFRAYMRYVAPDNNNNNGIITMLR